MKRPPGRRLAGKGKLEGLRDILRVHVMRGGNAVTGHGDRLAPSQPLPHGRIQVVDGIDHRPAGTADVPGMQRDAAEIGGKDQSRDLGLFVPYSP